MLEFTKRARRNIQDATEVIDPRREERERKLRERRRNP